MAQEEARAQGEGGKSELKRLQRQLAGVTGAKDAEIERLETRVATLEVTLRSRNAEAAALQVQCEQAGEQAEVQRQRLLAVQVLQLHAMHTKHSGAP
jgi:predicted RNase H-like nuclease (RuvC/YqgF family)